MTVCAEIRPDALPFEFETPVDRMKCVDLYGGQILKNQLNRQWRNKLHSQRSVYNIQRPLMACLNYCFIFLLLFPLL